MEDVCQWLIPVQLMMLVLYETAREVLSKVDANQKPFGSNQFKTIYICVKI